MRMTIGKRVMCGFASAVLITVGLGLFAFNRFTVVKAASDHIVTNALPGAELSGQIEAMTQQNVSLLLQHILDEDKPAMDEVENRMLGVKERLDKAYAEYEKAIDNEEERRLYGEASEARKGWLEAKSEAVALSRDGKKKEATQLFHEKAYPAFKNLRDSVNALGDMNVREADGQGKQITAAVDSGKAGAIIGLAVAVTIASIIGVVIVRSTNRALACISSTLADGATQVAAASIQVSASSQSLAQGAGEQAASLEETTSSLEEMSSMTRKNADTAQQAAALAGDTKSAADRGNDAMSRMGSAINDIQKSASETAKIIKVIDEIAFQTNLLALNAAVEAARAGEAGKGFAVVAEEVRNLAMRSAEAAKTTNSMIEGSVQTSRNGVTIAEEVGKTLHEITGSVAKVYELIGEIAAASREQAQGIGQINIAVSEMDKVTQSNAAAAEESAAASEELSSQAAQLSSVVRDLNDLVGAANPPASTPARAAPKAKPHVSTAAPKSGHSIKFPEDNDNTSFVEFSKAA